ncbi:hypothetical protein PCASD_00190 [Puccinia coronata f. sp. avenae]|uniref:Uncharacterized protein n=1 Tax=Puccinia coronata f. sp. avenae TaxID=200324 RepID=A0A2N5VQW2_9BASI|nr:hypothetical protein PCASD_00190 [Puccinia coronata f. sp. avenae]
MRFGVKNTPNERSADSNDSGSFERFQPATEMADDSVNHLQSQLNDLQTVMRQQNDMIASLQAAARAQALANTNPKLSFDGSNYTEWENAIDRTLQHVFVRDQTFLNDKQDNFHKLDSLQNKAVAVLMRGTLDDALLLIVESNEITASKDLFELLRSKCKMLGRHHKIILVKKILRFAAEKSPASESWLA